MKILIDCSNYFSDNSNTGDRAIYQVMLSRLTCLWPEAAVKFITLDPGLIGKTCPGAGAFVLGARHHWQYFPPRELPSMVRRGTRDFFRSLFPRKTRSQAEKRMRRNAVTTADAEPLIRELKNSDLVLASGGGWFSDAFARHAMGILDTLEAAIEFGKPTAIMGGGFEPVENPALIQKARSVLPRLNLIVCRENTTGPGVLRDFGVHPGNILVSGDDAVEIAFETHADAPGNGIGINLRVAKYSGIDKKHLDILGNVLQRTSLRHKARLIPVPISLFGPSDPDSIKVLIRDHSNRQDGGASLDTPEKLIHNISQCRIMVTGSYHAAVFALSKGLPVVALAGSQHYRMKLKGLSRMFGENSCTILSADSPDLPASLSEGIDKAWNYSELERENLLNAARQQIESGRQAYQALYDKTELHRLS